MAGPAQAKQALELKIGQELVRQGLTYTAA
jgi:hypothetical protein